MPVNGREAGESITKTNPQRVALVGPQDWAGNHVVKGPDIGGGIVIAQKAQPRGLRDQHMITKPAASCQARQWQGGNACEG